LIRRLIAGFSFNRYGWAIVLAFTASVTNRFAMSTLTRSHSLAGLALAGLVLPKGRALEIAAFLFLALAGSLALAVSSKISVPFYPVPMTLQTFALMAIVAAFGLRLGVVTVALYLLEGAIGLPVFAGTPEKGIGLAYMVGPTGGYLVGYLVAAIIVGLAVEKGFGRNPFTLFGAMVVADIVIFALGAAWLGQVVGWDKPIMAWGVTPFLLGDLVKIALAAALIPALWSLIERFKSR
jgi:biotin transport system substrate-specific component